MCFFKPRSFQSQHSHSGAHSSPTPQTERQPFMATRGTAASVFTCTAQSAKIMQVFWDHSAPGRRVQGWTFEKSALKAGISQGSFASRSTGSLPMEKALISLPIVECVCVSRDPHFQYHNLSGDTPPRLEVMSLKQEVTSLF